MLTFALARLSCCSCSIMFITDRCLDMSCINISWENFLTSVLIYIFIFLDVLSYTVE